MFRGIIRSIARFLPIAALLSVANTHVVEAIQRTGFDHLTTGFELRDAHRDMACEYCHVNGVFKGTPRTCEGCHTIGGRISATPKPPRHIATADNCALCHAGYNFAPVFRVDHTGVKGSCVSCHNSLTATGKDVKHIPSDNNCTACHTTVAFLPARMEHADLLQKEQCSGCHDGVRASAKTLHHVPTLASCNDCHTTLSWSPARFNHSGLLTNCQSCHNGITATGKVSNHVATPLGCSECHRYPSWSSLRVVRPPATERRPSGQRGNPQRGLAKEPPAGATTPIAKPPAPGQHKASDGAFH